MKRFVCIVLPFILLCMLCACGGASPGGGGTAKTLRIGVSAYDQYDTFISLLMERFHYYANEKNAGGDISITIIQESANGNQITQNDQVESFINAGCDVICVNLVDRTDVSVIIDKVEAAGIPALFFNRELVPEDLNRCDNLYYVGAEALVSGQMQGQLIVDLYNENPDDVDRNSDGIIQYVMLEGEAGHQDAIFRTEYSVNTLIDAGIDVERLDGAIASWTRTRAESKMTQWLAAYGPNGTTEKRMEVVFANNDDMALGAIDALKKTGLGRSEWPVIVGIDGTLEGLAAVKDNTMAGTVLNDADGQARALVELACSLYTGQPLPSDLTLLDEKYIRLPYEVITSENVQKYIDLYSQ